MSYYLPPTTGSGLRDLPAPRVRITGGDAHTGTAINGVTIDCTGIVFAQPGDLWSEYLTDPVYDLKLELWRYKGSRLGRVTHGVAPAPTVTVAKKRRGGMVHPSHYVGGVTPPHVAQTRGGAHFAVANQRPTEWSMTGFANYQAIKLPVGEVFAPYFNECKVRDAANNTIRVWRYSGGNKTSNIGRKGYSGASLTGVFALRFSIYNPDTKRREVGELSDEIYIRPLAWPFLKLAYSDWRVNPVGAVSLASGGYDPEGKNRILTASHSKVFN